MGTKENSKQVLFNLQRTVVLQNNRIEELTSFITRQNDDLRKAVFMIQQLDKMCYIQEQQAMAAADLLKRIVVTYSWCGVHVMDPPTGIPLVVCDEERKLFTYAIYNGVNWTNAYNTGEPEFEVFFWRHVDSPEKLIGFVQTYNSTLVEISKRANQPAKVIKKQQAKAPVQEELTDESPLNNIFDDTEPKKIETKDNSRAREQMQKAMEKYREYQHLIGHEVADGELTDIFNKFCVYCQGEQYLNLDERKQREIHLALDRLIRDRLD